ncbi:MAG: hypothetical protein SOW55_00680 [Bacilli bacterium]|nr:hypothetical protein [Bacillales bacterium]MDY2574491.1 hypothetical protein [Bacilli bacterium]
MKENYSVVSLRLNELKKHYLFKVFLSFCIPLVILSLFYIAYILPIKYEVFYSSFINRYLQFIYSNNNTQHLINIMFGIIIILLSFLFSFITFFVLNKHYQKMFKVIFQDELKLNEFYPHENDIYYFNRKFEIIYKYLPFSNIDKECLLSLKKDNIMIFYQLFLKGIKGNKAGLILLKTSYKNNDFLEINTFGNCLCHIYNDKNIFEFNYDNPKYSSSIKVYSTYSLKTNEICDNSFLSEFDSLQRYINAKIIIISFEDIICLIIPGWKFNLSENIFKKVDKDLMEKKVECIDTIYNYLKSLSEIIIFKGEKS